MHKTQTDGGEQHQTDDQHSQRPWQTIDGTSTTDRFVPHSDHILSINVSWTILYSHLYVVSIITIGYSMPRLINYFSYWQVYMTNPILSESESFESVFTSNHEHIYTHYTPLSVG